MSEVLRKRILIVDDEAALVRMLESQLAPIGFEVHAVTHGKQALSYAAEHNVDLAILDINLPDINGYEVAKELRRVYSPWVLPIIMLTVRDRPVDQLRGFAHGADAYLTKPFASIELFQTIGLLLGEEALAFGGEAPRFPLGIDGL